MGGMAKISEAMKDLAVSMGVTFHTNTAINRIHIENKKVVSLSSELGSHRTDVIIGSADYHHVEQNLLEKKNRNYSESYWNKKVLAPSSLIFYLGVNKRIKNLKHHNLFFDTNFNRHAAQIYNDPQWPDDPLFYVCCPSKTDDTVAPQGMENIFILIPLAAGLKDTKSLHEDYFLKVMKRLEKACDDTIADSIVFKRSYCLDDFKSDYNAFKGNAYGLANTLSQTAVFKPSIKNKHVSNLFYTGQLTVPGPGVPPAIISGKIVTDEIAKYLHEHSSTS